MADIKILDVNGEPINASTAMSSYEGAGDGFGDELLTWDVGSVSADAALIPTLNTGNARAADSVRNDGYAKSGVQLHIDNIVGNQFKLVYKPNYLVLGLDYEQIQDFVKEVEAKWTDYAEDPRCFIDAERKRTFTMLCRASAGAHCITGEVTAKAEWRPMRGTPYATAIKMIDYARISNPDGVMESKKIRGGIKLDRHGAAVGAYVRKAHPNDLGMDLENAHKWVYVPRELKFGRTQFIHIFEPEFADQTRGANNFLAALSKLKMLEKFQKTTLQNAIINAMYAAVIESDLPSEEVFKALGGGNKDAMEGITNFMKYKGQWSKATNMRLNGSKIAHLLPSEKLKLQNVNAPSSSLGEFESGILRYIASSLGVSYEQLTKDFSKVNYSSARASIGEAFRYFLGKRATIVARFASTIFELWFEEAVNTGQIKLPKSKLGFYDARHAWTRCKWIGAGKPAIDGLKEIKEAIEKISSGLSTYDEELANMGKDYVEVFEQQYREKMELEKYGRKPIWETSAYAGSSPEPSEEEGEDDEGDEDQQTEVTNENPEIHENT